MDNPKEPLTVISFCSGYGGIERGLDLAGVDGVEMSQQDAAELIQPNYYSKQDRQQLLNIAMQPDGQTWITLGNHHVVSNRPPTNTGCLNCGGTMIGDGYTTARHCEFADVETTTPDAGPVFCDNNDYQSIGEALMGLPVQMVTLQINNLPAQRITSNEAKQVISSCFGQHAVDDWLSYKYPVWHKTLNAMTIRATVP